MLTETAGTVEDSAVVSVEGVVADDHVLVAVAGPMGDGGKL